MSNEKVECVTGSIKNFWNAFEIYYNHPSSINKQILLSQHLFGGQLNLLEGDEKTFLEVYNIICESLDNEFDLVQSLDTSNYFLSTNNNLGEVLKSSANVYLFIRKLIPKRYIGNYEHYECIFLDKSKVEITIKTINKQSKNDGSCLHMSKDPLCITKFEHICLTFNLSHLKLKYNETLGHKGVTWLSVIFLPKFINIMKNTITQINKKNKTSEKLNFSGNVDIVEYYRLYEEMKSKYAEFLIKSWTENTDPKKFVYEDIGIATYLLLLWKTNNESKRQKFIDLGCGNGLLVHILNSEGHLGIGLDMRKRKIWDGYDKKTILKVETIIPTENTKYPEVDWLIGNHSDELTPWIPIMARRNSSTCQYFVLPCCPYQLNGQKFQRKNSGLSSYRDFINHVKDISELCDFKTYVDRLRIPSTKRVCLIGVRKPSSTPEGDKLVDKAVLEFIKFHCESETQQESTLLAFKVRESVEKVRNCTKLQQRIIDEVLQKVMTILLDNKCLIEVMKNNQLSTWNRGEKIAITSLAQLIEDDLLKQLKNECKGLQTLLKNHHYLFEVNAGMVQFRSPQDLEKISKNYFYQGDKSKWKNRRCWFNDNHPNGCPLSDEMCSYKHK